MRIIKIFQSLSVFLFISLYGIETAYHCNFENGCNQKKNEYLKVEFVCKSLKARFIVKNSIKLDKECIRSFKHSGLIIYYRMSWPTRLTDSFDPLNFIQLQEQLNFLIANILFRNINGFDIINSYNLIGNNNSSKYVDQIVWNFQFIDSRLEFFANNKLIKSCEEYLKSKQISLFQTIKNIARLAMHTVRFKTPVCPLVFNNSIIDRFEISNLVETFFHKNVIKFLNLDVKISSSIYSLSLRNSKNIHIDSSLLHEHIFSYIHRIHLYGEIRSIQVDLFSNFKYLTSIYIQINNFMKLTRTQGINWIRSINKKENTNLARFITIMPKYLGVAVLNDFDSNSNDDFTDADFCLFVRFPFDQLVFMIEIREFTTNLISCTRIWLHQHDQMIESRFPDIYGYFLPSLSDRLERCGFDQKLAYCNKTNFKHVKINHNSNRLRNSMLEWEFVCLILKPLIATVGFVLNILVVLTVTNEKNKKSLKANSYKFMKLKSLCNLAILFIQIFSLINVCQSNTDIFCSSIRKFMIVQYFEIIFIEFACNYLRFVSNLYHIAFVVNRLSLIGTEHNKFTIYMTKLKVKNFSIFAFFIGIFVTIAKGFRLRANTYFPQWEYPFVYVGQEDQHKYALQLVITIFSILCDLLNGLGFFIFSIIIDLQLLIKIKQVTKSKQEKIGMIAQSNQESTKSNCENAIMRTILMVVLNSSVNLFFKSPNTLMSIVDVVKLVVGYSNDLVSVDYLMIPQKLAEKFVICGYFRICQALEQFSNLLFLVSIGMDFFFYYYFDNNFKLAIKNVSLKKTSK